MDIVEQTVKSGVAPLELVYQQVISTRSERRAAFRAQLRINSLELGTLMPMQYQEISLKNIQSERLAAWVIEKLTEEIDKIDIASIQYDWISFYAPVRMLYRNKLYNKLSRLIKNGKIKDCSKIALEFSSDILYVNKETLRKYLNDIKSLGFLLILNDFGGEYCPITRVYEMPFDIVILNSYVKHLTKNDKTKKIAKNIINYARDLDLRVTMTDVDSEPEISEAYENGCSLCIGEVSGDYKKVSQIVV